MADSASSLRDCLTAADPHSGFLAATLGANGQYPQINVGIRTRVLAQILRSLEAPLETVIRIGKAEDVATAAQMMDRLHAHIGIGALSYRSINEDIFPGDINVIKNQIHGLDN